MIKKNELSLMWLLQGAEQLAEELGLEKENFHLAAAEVRSLVYENIQDWKSPVASP